ncbi:hypothetical protein IAE35_00335 [Pseudomonas sp. S75]|uniref:hypothetical protein n=1 Tax=unclassified Pseudomonas TaxID=196821 RepID=UPI0019071C5A|nr:MULTISPECIES: hypothetical protein [unclassified Pseudomonas]MBJ9974286.1 hypothetical protein [Pseudomonas sp. S30]MBK0151784.1 hypothetical protein [Pseudomonas sp. S75]
MNAFKSKVLNAYHECPVPHRFYLASMTVYLLGLMACLRWGSPSLTLLTGLTSLLVLCGFTLWCLPLMRWIHSVWHRPFAKIPILLLHLLALLIATACARFAVADSLGLPPQSFDLTVGFLVALFYIPAWLAVMGLLLACAAILIMFIALLTLPFEALWQQLALLLNPLLRTPLPVPSRNMMIFHGLGALYACFLLTTAYGYATEDFGATFKGVVTVIALKSDFHQTPNYPGYRSDEYLHPLENGYTAFIRSLSDHSTVIGVRSQTEQVSEVVIETLPSFKTAFESLFEGVSS